MDALQKILLLRIVTPELDGVRQHWVDSLTVQKAEPACSEACPSIPALLFMVSPYRLAAPVMTAD